MIKLLKILIFCIINLYCLKVAGQKDTILYNSQKKFQLGFSLNGTIVSPLKIEKVIGVETVISLPSPSYELELNTKFNYNKNLSILANFIYGRLPFHLKFEIPAEKYEYIDYNWACLNTIDYGASYRSFSLNLEYILYRIEKWKFGLIFGIDFKDYKHGITSIEYQYTDNNDSNINVFNSSFFYNYPKYRIRTNYESGLFVYRKLKNYDNLKIGLKFNYSNETIMEGYYDFFYNTENYSTGFVSSSGNYWVLNLSYYFSGKKIRDKSGRKVTAISTFF